MIGEGKHPGRRGSRRRAGLPVREGGADPDQVEALRDLPEGLREAEEDPAARVHGGGNQFQGAQHVTAVEVDEDVAAEDHLGAGGLRRSRVADQVVPEDRHLRPQLGDDLPVVPGFAEVPAALRLAKPGELPLLVAPGGGLAKGAGGDVGGDHPPLGDAALGQHHGDGVGLVTPGTAGAPYGERGVQGGHDVAAEGGNLGGIAEEGGLLNGELVEAGLERRPFGGDLLHDRLVRHAPLLRGVVEPVVEPVSLGGAETQAHAALHDLAGGVEQDLVGHAGTGASAARSTAAAMSERGSTRAAPPLSWAALGMP